MSSTSLALEPKSLDARPKLRQGVQGVGAASVQAPVGGLETTCLWWFQAPNHRMAFSRWRKLTPRPMKIAPSVPIATCQIPSSAGDVVPRERPRTKWVWGVGKGWGVPISKSSVPKDTARWSKRRQKTFFECWDSRCSLALMAEELFSEGASFPRREILRFFDPVPGLLCSAGKTSWTLQFPKVSFWTCSAPERCWRNGDSRPWAQCFGFRRPGRIQVTFEITWLYVTVTFGLVAICVANCVVACFPHASALCVPNRSA